VRLGRLIVRRSLIAVVQLLGASIIICVIVRVLPGNPVASILGSTAGPSQRAALTRSLGLDKSIPVQYWIWLKHVLGGDFGRSFVTSNPVLTDIGQRLPATLELITVALILAVVVLVPLGVLTVRRPGIVGRVLDKATFSYGMLAGSMPDFFLGLVLIFVFYFTLKVAPAPVGRLDIALTPPPQVTGFYLIDSVLAGDWATFKSALAHLALPAITLAFVYGSPILKMTRQTMSRLLDEEYIQQARGLGLSDTQLRRTALKNALPPVIVLIGVTYGYVIGGDVLVETIFSWGGLGQYAVQAITNADFDAIQGFVMVATAISIVIYLVVDIVHAWIDPRVAT
jgi:peptide/nickel transport system permease protein